MAATTLTYTLNMSASPREVFKGVNHLEFDFNSGATKLGTLSDVLLVGKLPNGSTLLTSELNFGASGAAAIHWQLLALGTDAGGTFTILNTIIPSMTQSTAAATFRAAKPIKFSLSDDRAVQYITLALNCSTGASGTVSNSIQGLFLYAADGTTP